ncbi:MAG: hypothetical protein V4469_02330 [Patescibacteria group bacterium]
MENNNQSSVKTKNITLGSVFSWVFGVVMLLTAVSTIFTKPLSGILFLLIAIIVLPPSNKLIKEKLHINLSRGLKVFLVLVLFVIIGTTSSSNVMPSVVTDKSVSVPVPEQPAIKVTATKLLADYKANEVSADAKYKNNIVEVSGLVDTIGKDIVDTPYISLTDGSQYSFENVQCMFSKADETQLATVSKGDRLTLKGELSGKLGNVLVNGCSIVK